MQRNKTWLWLAGITVLYVLLRLHALAIPLDRDEGTFGYAGQRILQGEKLYRDVVDHKPPGVFYIYAFALRFVSPTPEGVHVFLAIYNFLTLLAIAALVHARFPGARAWLGAAFCYAVFSASPAIQGFTASTEMLMLLPITLSVFLAVEGNKRHSATLIVLSGAAAAAAFWIKQTAATSVAFALLYLLMPDWLGNGQTVSKIRERIRDTVYWLVGGLVLSAAIAGYFYFAGLFPEFIYWSFTHNLEYASQVPLSESLQLILGTVTQIMRGDAVILALGIFIALWGWKKRTHETLFVLGFLAVSFAGAVPGFAYPHYFAQLAPAAAVAAGWGLSVLSSSKKLNPWVYVLPVLIVVVPLWVHYGYYVQSPPEKLSRQYFGVNPFAESSQLSSFLRARTTDRDRVFIFGSEPEILFQAGRKSATPFVMIYPLTQAYPRYLEFQEQVWRDIQRSKPRYVVVVDIETSILWDGQAKLEIADRVNNMVQRQYQLIAMLPMRQEEIPSKLVVLNKGEIPPSGPGSSNQPNIYVYELKGNS